MITQQRIRWLVDFGAPGELAADALDIADHLEQLRLERAAHAETGRKLVQMAAELGEATSR